MALRDYGRDVRSSWWLILMITLIAVGVGLAWTLRQAPTYEATARLFVSAPGGSSAKAGDQASSRTQSYVAALTGYPLSRRVVTELGLSETPRQLSRHITASMGRGSADLKVTVDDPSADRAQLLANAVAKEFVSYVPELEASPSGTATVKATVIDYAPRPKVPSSPRPLLNAGSGLLLGLLAGLIIVAIRRALDTTVRDPELVEEILDAPILGGIPFDRHALDEPSIRELEPYDPRVEAYRVIRTGLEFTELERDHKIIVVTSSVPDEGKTSTAINLALILAEGGSRVALIDGDLRRPKVADYLGLVENVGLTTVLIGHSSLQDAVQEVGALDILSSGRIPPNPAELIKTSAAHDLFEKLRSTYEYVIIDAPPLLPVTDASILAALADGVVVVTAYGETRKTELTAAAERLRQVDAYIVGAVLNLTPARTAAEYGYAYGYPPEDANVSRR